jgi:hypothetical protein
MLLQAHHIGLWDRMTNGARCAALLAGLCACAAEVQQFEPTLHRHICSGEQVGIRWKVAGSATLMAKPPVTGLANGPVPDEGVVTIIPTVTTQIDLYVTRFLGRSTTRTQEIEVKGSGETEHVTASLGGADAMAGCKSGQLWATAQVKRFSPNVLVERVSSYPGDPRTYQVEHAGVTTSVVPGTPSAAFTGKPINGPWAFRITLEPGQACDDPSIPNNLVVDVATQCQAGET